MRIPTVLAIAILIIALIIASASFYFYQQKQQEQKLSLIPKSVSVVNLSDTSAAIFWQTDVNTTGAIIININNTEEELQDDRVYQKEFTKHIVTLKNLAADTKYTYTIKSNDQRFTGNDYTFITAKPSSIDNNQTSTPLFGTVIDSSLQPVEEAIITLDIKNFSPILAISDVTGNFIIPLNSIYNKPQTQKLDLTKSTEATLTITKDDKKSVIQVIIPPKNNLPPVTIGQDADLKTYLATSSTQPKPNQGNKFDLNNDGKINSLDLSQVIQAINNKINDPKLDFNNDGVVDQKDIDLINQAAQ